MTELTPEQQFHKFVLGVWIARFLNVTNFTIQLYNYFTTLDQELYYYKTSRVGSKGFILFILNRYLPFANAFLAVYVYLLADTDSAEYCRLMLRMIIYLFTLQSTVAEFVLYLRAATVWTGNRIVNYFVIVFALTVFGFSLYSAHDYTPTTSPKAVTIDVLSFGCGVCGSGSITRILSVIAVAEIASLTLLLAKVVLSAQHAFNRVYTNVPNILELMMKEGIAYFLCIFAICAASMIANVLSQLGKNKFVHVALLPLQATLQNILCVRLLLHARLVNAVAKGGHENELSLLVATEMHLFGLSEFRARASMPIKSSSIDEEERMA